MNISSIRTNVLYPPQDDLYAFLDSECPPLQEKDILVITSKLVAIHQGRCVPTTTEKIPLIEQEADALISPHDHMLTIKHNTFVPFAGIDESNGNSYYILWPDNPYQAAQEIHRYLSKKFSCTQLGVIITDSTLYPMRKGTLGISIGHFGIEPLRNYIGDKDIFDRTMVYSRNNVVDSLASIAALAMGEGAEQQPLVIIKEVDDIAFCTHSTEEELYIDEHEDIFASLIHAHLHTQ